MSSASSNLLWKFVFSGVAALLLGGGVLCFVLPALRNVADVQTNLCEEIQARQKEAKKAARNDSFVYYPRGSEPIKPLAPRSQPLVPGFQSPPATQAPSTYIDSRGTMRIR
jgi:hypothetical protein